MRTPSRSSAAAALLALAAFALLCASCSSRPAPRAAEGEIMYIIEGGK